MTVLDDRALSPATGTKQAEPDPRHPRARLAALCDGDTLRPFGDEHGGSGAYGDIPR
ncbi:hypothetical protein [Spirillospora sp. NBC_01491]|uniref:hypothetical protein n=1 Tax=Spirillospora sp. NBC_01491 TaxID=2976007 RepID=UPI002E30F09B|nr:hypothetical protein [Spirillospora sp. NBC_01491]